MDALTLLRDARRAGLEVSTRGQRLVVRGPRRLEPVAEQLLAQKSAVVKAIADEREVAWRVKAMRPQATTSGAIPLLIARPGASWRPGSCCSCGGQLGGQVAFPLFGRPDVGQDEAQHVPVDPAAADQLDRLARKVRDRK